jgi:hypothetical protein
MLTANDARKLLRNVKENKIRNIYKLTEPIISEILESIKKAIDYEKDSILVDVSKIDKLHIAEVISKFKKLGYSVNYVSDKDISINWKEEVTNLEYIRGGEECIIEFIRLYQEREFPNNLFI